MKTMNSITVAVLSWLQLPGLLFGQSSFSHEQVFEDYTILKNVLTEGHPSLYEYTSASEWDSLFQAFENEQLPEIRSTQALYNALAGLTDHVRDGHLVIMRPPLETIPNLFPLLLKIIDGKFYTDTDEFDIPVGSEILSINEVTGSELRNRLHQYASSDGFNTTKKDRQVEREFGILHFYEFGAQERYEVEYQPPSGQVISKQIDSQPVASIGSRFSKRYSFFSRYHGREDQSEFVRSTLGNKEPFVYFLDSVDAAVLTMNAFGIDQEYFQTTLKSLFKEIRKQKVQHLVIDLRQNEGGYPENANFAFSYIARDSFIQPRSQHVISSQLPEQAHAQELINGYSYESFFGEYFRDADFTDNEWTIQAPLEEGPMAPSNKRFTGEVYVLIGGNTFSAGATFALNCKNQGIPLVGEETGGSLALHTGGYPVIYTLPHSKIKVLMSFVKHRKVVHGEAQPLGRGVCPDLEVELSLEELREGIDGPLDAALGRIREE